MTELSTVVALTRWAKEGAAPPFFLWCLRDFALDMREYKSSDDYLETVLNPAEFPSKSEKNVLRRTLTDYFPQRSCLTFARPLDDETAIRQIDKHKLSELKPKFAAAVEVFKRTVFSKLTPKRFDQKLLNGPAYARLI